MERANDTALESDGGNEPIKANNEPIQAIPEPDEQAKEADEPEIEAVLPVKPRNIIFCGSGEPFTAIHGSFRTILPSADEQRTGFYHPEANRIIAAYPSKYKRFQKLGDI